jgi:hypothetical protein
LSRNNPEVSVQRIWQLFRGKPILTLVIAASVFAAVFAFAATLGVSSNTLGAGGDAVVSCDEDGVSVAYATQYSPTLAPQDTLVPGLGGYKVTVVTIDDIDAACDGAEMKVVLTGPGTSKDVLNNVSDEIVQTVSGTSETVDFSTADIAAADVTGVSVVISGDDLTP